MRRLAALASLVAALLTAPASAAPGDPDPAFNGGQPRLVDASERTDANEHTRLRDVAFDAQGRTVFGGITYIPGGDGFTPRSLLVRLKDDGSNDGTFDGDGFWISPLNVNEELLGVLRDPNGRIGFGSVIGTTTFVAGRLQDSGALDGTYGPGGTRTIGGRYDATLRAVTGHDGSTFFLGRGDPGDPCCNGTISISKLTPAGAVDTSFGGGDGIRQTTLSPGTYFPLFFHDAVTDPQGRIVIAGGRLGQTGGTRFMAARLLPDGEPDPTFGGGDGWVEVQASAEHPRPYSVAHTVSIAPDGSILLGGEAEAGLDDSVPAMVKLTTAGVPDASFGTGGFARVPPPTGFGWVWGVAAAADGKPVAIVYAGPEPAIRRTEIWRFGTDGTLDNSFGGDGRVDVALPPGIETIGRPMRAVITADGKLLVAGSVLRAGKYLGIVGRYLLAAGVSEPPDEEEPPEEPKELPPETQITGGPTATNNAAATFTFTATPPAGATFECRLDGGAPEPCTSPFTTGILEPGSHTFRVRAANAAGADPTAAIRTFVVDRVPPEVALEVRGQRLASGAYAGSVQVDLTATDPPGGSGVDSRFCVLNPATAPTRLGLFGSRPCPAVVATPGTHTVYGIANDKARNESTIVSTTFRILPEPDTTITRAPTGLLWTPNAEFAFTSTFPGSTFRCRIDGGPFVPCTSPYVTPVVASGEHVLEVAAVSAEGVADSTPARSAFTIATPGRHRYTCNYQPVPGAIGGFSGVPGCALVTCPAGRDALRECFDSSGSTTRTQVRGIRESCPRGAVCTLTARVQWYDADDGVNWGAGASVSMRGRTPGAYAHKNCETGFSGDRCTATATATGLGDDSKVQFYCNAADIERRSAKLGGDSIRRFECEATLEIKLAPPLALSAASDRVTFNAPGPGRLVIVPGGPAGARAAAAAVRPLFRASPVTVTRAGPVTVALNLSKAAKRTLKRKRKLGLSLAVRFTPAAGGPMVRLTRKVTLRPVGGGLRLCRRVSGKRRCRSV